MKYNTQEKAMPMPEYGRAVQKMVDHAVTIEDRAERQRCANTIIAVMGNMYPQLRDVAEFKHKLWDHLAIMADFKLDIDYPYELVAPETLHPIPEHLPYPKGGIRYRHYGRILGEMIEKAVELEDEEERKQLVDLIAVRMKKSFIGWNKDGVEDQKDYCRYGNTDNKGHPEVGLEYPAEAVRAGSEEPYGRNRQKGYEQVIVFCTTVDGGLFVGRVLVQQVIHGNAEKIGHIFEGYNVG